jgi:hypothetical protein
MMKRHVFQEAVDAFKHRQPFRPFVVEMDDGQRLVVNSPEPFQCYAGAGTYTLPDGYFMFVDNEDVKQVVELTPTPAG